MGTNTPDEAYEFAASVEAHLNKLYGNQWMIRVEVHPIQSDGGDWLLSIGARSRHDTAREAISFDVVKARQTPFGVELLHAVIEQELYLRTRELQLERGQTGPEIEFGH